jgi:small-conductance mechanosensitive channel
MIKILRFVGLLFLLLSYFSTVLSLFELTRGWGKILFESILSPVRTVGNSIINYIPNLFFLIAVAFLGYYGIAVIRFLFQEIQKGKLKISGFNKEWSETTYKISRFLFIVFLAIIAFPYLPGADSEAFKGISLFLGVLFSLGSTSVIANIVAGVILTYMLPFRVGDRIQIGETTGDVLEKTLLVTRIRTVKNVVVTIPNSAILGNQIVNFSSQAIPDPIILHISIGLGYDVPWRKVHSVMKRAAAKTNLVLKKPGPFVLQTALDDFFVSYELNVYSDHPHSQAKILSDLMANVLDECAKSDIEIMSPNYLAYRDGNASTIPTDKSGDL